MRLFLFISFLCGSGAAAQAQSFTSADPAWMAQQFTATSAGGSGGAFVRTGLIGEYLFASSDGTDTSGSGNTLTVNNSPTFGTADLGAGSRPTMTLDGSSQYLSTASTAFDFTAGDFTIQTWVYFNAAATTDVFQKGNNSGYELFMDPGGNLNFKTYQAAASQTSISSVPPLAGWCNVAVVRSGSSGIIYINGVNANLVSGTHINPDSASAFSLGIGRNGTFASNYLAGKLAQLFIYNRALSSTEIGNNYSHP